MGSWVGGRRSASQALCRAPPCGLCGPVSVPTRTSTQPGHSWALRAGSHRLWRVKFQLGGVTMETLDWVYLLSTRM